MTTTQPPDATTETAALDTRPDRAPVPVGDEWVGLRLGRYTILEVVGNGAMGVVYAAYDPTLDRKVALKLVRHPSEKLSARLLREAKALAKLSHPNVVPVYDAGVVDDQVFIAMEYVAGQTLREWSKQPDAQHSWQDVVDMFVQVGRGLAAAHSSGIIHRDFKPANVLIGADGRPRVVDFGIASIADSEEAPTDPDDTLDTGHISVDTPLTRTGAIIGTPAYMSPERLAGKPSTIADDVYAFTVALYESLYGFKPTSATDVDTLRNELESRELTAPSTGVGGTPRWLWKIIQAGIARHKADRYETMTQILGAMERARGLKRRRGLLVGGAVAISVLGGLVYLAAASGTTTTPEPPCQTAEAHLGASASADTLARIDTAFAKSRLVYASTAAANARAALQRYRTDWTSTHTSVCLASHHGVQSSELLDLRMFCLDRRRAALTATADLLAKADDRTVKNAARIIAGLPSATACAAMVRFVAKENTAPKPHQKATVAALVTKLAKATALRHAGDYKTALPIAREVASQAKEIGYPPLHAEAMSLAGGLAAAVVDYDAAERDLKDAYWLAIRIGDDALAAKTAARLIGFIAGARGDQKRALVWARHGDALAHRVGDDSQASGAVFMATGVLYMRRRQLDLAENNLTRARTILEAKLGPSHPNVSALLNNLGVVATMRGKHERSAVFYQKSYDIKMKVHGPNHPETIAMLNNIALPLAFLGKFDEAKTYYVRALAGLEKLFGKTHPELIEPLTNIGLVYLELHKPKRAQPYLRRAKAIRTKVSGPKHPEVGELATNLGRALYEAGDAAAAEAELARAVEIVRAKFGDVHPRLMEPLYRHGLALRKLNRGSDARKALAQAAKIGDKFKKHDPDTVAAVAKELASLSKPTR